MSRIKGITARLITKTETGKDGFNRLIYKEDSENVANVLVDIPLDWNQKVQVKRYEQAEGSTE